MLTPKTISIIRFESPLITESEKRKEINKKRRRENIVYAFLLIWIWKRNGGSVGRNSNIGVRRVAPYPKESWDQGKRERRQLMEGGKRGEENKRCGPQEKGMERVWLWLWPTQTS